MTCKEMAELMMDYCDGVLPPEYCDLICEHMRCCGPCHNYLESYRITIRITRKLPRTDVPLHILDKVRAALKELDG